LLLIPTHDVAAMFVDARAAGAETRERREAILKKTEQHAAPLQCENMPQH